MRRDPSVEVRGRYPKRNGESSRAAPAAHVYLYTCGTCAEEREEAGPHRTRGRSLAARIAVIVGPLIVASLSRSSGSHRTPRRARFYSPFSGSLIDPVCALDCRKPGDLRGRGGGFHRRQDPEHEVLQLHLQGKIRERLQPTTTTTKRANEIKLE